MTPTNKLRFVEREITTPISETIGKIETVKILQQWWEKDPYRLDATGEMIGEIKGEWLDVPVEIE